MHLDWNPFFQLYPYHMGKCIRIGNFYVKSICLSEFWIVWIKLTVHIFCFHDFGRSLVTPCSMLLTGLCFLKWCFHCNYLYWSVNSLNQVNIAYFLFPWLWRIYHCSCSLQLTCLCFLRSYFYCNCVGHWTCSF